MRSVLVSVLILALFLAARLPAAATEIETELVSAGTPGLGIYQVTFLSTSVNLDPHLTRGYNSLVDFHFEQAIPDLQQCVADNGSHPDVASEALTFLGYAYLNLRQPTAAVDSLNHALALRPDNHLAHYFLAQEYYLDNDRGQEKAHLLEAVRIHPSFVAALRMLAESYKEEGRGREAMQTYQRCVDILPNSGYYRYQLYHACLEAGAYRSAMDALKALIRIEPNFPINHGRLGDVYVAMGRYPEALQEYGRLEGSKDFGYKAHLGYARVYEKEGQLDVAQREAALAVAASNHNQEAVALAARIEHERLDRFHRQLEIAVAWVLAAFLLGTLVALNRSLTRRKHVLSELHKFNDEVGHIHDQDELSAFLLQFFGRLMGAETSAILLHNRFNNQLTCSVTRGMDDELELTKMKIITGGDLPSWTIKEARALLPVAEMEAMPGFEGMFPSLLSRLRKAGVTWLLLLRERDFFLGFLAIGPTRYNKTEVLRTRDVLSPLLSSGAKALETLILYETSMVDETTGLFNKRYFRQSLNIELKRADRYQQPLTLITFDLDDFKKINDTYGHAQGDQVLKGIGEVLRRNIREGIDTVARTGGEEFHLILPATTSDRALVLAERVRQSIEEHRFEGFTKPVRVTISMGLATYPMHAGDEPHLIEKCDAAQYKAKRSGKNRVCVAEAEATADAGKSDGKAVPLLETRIDNLNIVDAATSLYNFTFFSMRLREEFRRTGRYPTPVSLIVIHLAAELDDAARLSMLRQLGILVRESMRDGIDTPCRLESGEVAVLVPETRFDAACKLAARLLDLIGQKGINAAIGVCGYPEHATTEADLLAGAVEAARSGTGVVIATPRHTETVKD
ncbi:MAG: diguanylate cyclase [Candidatus Xenobia bacterium]